MSNKKTAGDQHMASKDIVAHQFPKGISGNPNGRPKKYVTILRDHGYKLSEINHTIQVLMAMNMQEVQSVFDDPNSTILEKTIANAMIKSMKKGSLYSIDTLLTRVYGKPKEQMDIKTDNKIEIVYTRGATIL